mgnify:CR=1 FL=1
MNIGKIRAAFMLTYEWLKKQILTMRQPKTKVILIPINKKWWQFWRFKRRLKRGKHYVIDKGTICFKRLQPGKYECRVEYCYEVQNRKKEG